MERLRGGVKRMSKKSNKKLSVEEIKNFYSKGTRIELVKMKDVQAPPIGTRGTIQGVDDIGSILVVWDNGSSLNVVLPEDKIIVLIPVTTICYGKERKWESRLDAFHFFTDCYLNSEGSEQERYAKILYQLRSKSEICSDEK